MKAGTYENRAVLKRRYENRGPSLYGLGGRAVSIQLYEMFHGRRVKYCQAKKLTLPAAFRECVAEAMAAAEAGEADVAAEEANDRYLTVPPRLGSCIGEV